MAKGEPGCTRSKPPNRDSSGGGTVCIRIADLTEGRSPAMIQPEAADGLADPRLGLLPGQGRLVQTEPPCVGGEQHEVKTGRAHPASRIHRLPQCAVVLALDDIKPQPVAQSRAHDRRDRQGKRPVPHQT